jgi:hypothetical protein
MMRHCGEGIFEPSKHPLSLSGFVSFVSKLLDESALLCDLFRLICHIGLGFGQASPYGDFIHTHQRSREIGGSTDRQSISRDGVQASFCVEYLFGQPKLS